MKKIFSLHPQAILVGLAFLLLAVLGTYLFWESGVLLASVRLSLKVPSVSESPVGFDIESAKALNLNLGE